jgi:predicted nucleic acid-binding protein
MGLVLDTSVFIDAERKHLLLVDFLKTVRARFDRVALAVATVTISELEHGIWRAEEAPRQQRRRRFLEELIATVPTISLNTEIARRIGRIDADCRKAGVAIPFQDLVIGVTALEFGYGVDSQCPPF